MIQKDEEGMEGEEKRRRIKKGKLKSKENREKMTRKVMKRTLKLQRDRTSEVEK